VPRATGPIDTNSARIVVSRGNDFSGAVVSIGIIDSGKQIGAIGPGGQIAWDRIVGPMQLVSFDTRWPSDITYIKPLRVCVGAGMIYQFKAYWPTFSNDRYPKIELVSGTPVACEQSGTKTIAAKAEDAQPPSVPTTAAQTTSNAGEKARDGRFIAYDNRTVLDTKTNLMWAAMDNGSDINWQGAKSYCENYRGGGYTDWRMPTLDELAGLYDESKSRPTSSCRALFSSYTIYVATELINITCFKVLASDTNGSEVGNFWFAMPRAPRKSWHKQSFSENSRALPVRFVKANASTDSSLSRETTISTDSTTGPDKVEQVQQPTVKGEETKIFIGKIEKVTPILGGWSAPYNKIVVTDDKGIQETFFVFRATVITDTSGKDFSGSGTKRDKKVEVKYSIITNGSSITNGKYKADSIKYLD